MVKGIIALAGEPGSGKTTMMRLVRNKYTDLQPFKYKKVYGEVSQSSNVYFIGVFNGDMFEGTDKLSMAVQPDFIEFLDKIDGVVVFEGDRLVNQSLLDKVKIDLYVIKMDSKQLSTRRQQRGSNQTETFLKSKKTKVSNLIQNNQVTFIKNDSNEDLINGADNLYLIIQSKSTC